MIDMASDLELNPIVPSLSQEWNTAKKTGDISFEKNVYKVLKKFQLQKDEIVHSRFSCC